MKSKAPSKKNPINLDRIKKHLAKPLEPFSFCPTVADLSNPPQFMPSGVRIPGTEFPFTTWERMLEHLAEGLDAAQALRPFKAFDVTDNTFAWRFIWVKPYGPDGIWEHGPLFLTLRKGAETLPAEDLVDRYLEALDSTVV